ncbi:MAG: ABC transporter permease [Planctomycetota bacterium]
MNDLWHPIWVSLETACIATLVSVLIGVPCGYALAMRSFRGRHALITLLNTLLAVPTVVVGLFVYMLIARRAPLGPLGLLFSVPAMIIGQALLALPIVVVLAHAAFAAVEQGARETALTLGAGPGAVTLTLIREARFGLMAAVTATFGRLIGEVGISMMLGGNIAGYTRTMTTAIALETSKGEFALGMRLGGILLAIALVVNLMFKYFQGRGEA